MLTIHPFSCEIQIFSGIMSKPDIGFCPEFAYFLNANNPVKTFCNIYLHFERNYERKFEIVTIPLFGVEFKFY